MPNTIATILTITLKAAPETQSIIHHLQSVIKPLSYMPQSDTSIELKQDYSDFDTSIENHVLPLRAFIPDFDTLSAHHQNKIQNYLDFTYGLDITTDPDIIEAAKYTAYASESPNGDQVIHLTMTTESAMTDWKTGQYISYLSKKIAKGIFKHTSMRQIDTLVTN